MQLTSIIKNRLINRLGLNRVLKKDPAFENVVSYFDTSISSLNIGDEIINDSGLTEIQGIFNQKQIFISSTHNGISSKCISIVNNTKVRFVCGSNLLSPDIIFRGCWNISIFDILRLRKLTFVAVGWERYSEKESIFTKLFYKYIFDKDNIHSVRDEYTKEKLLSFGIKNVINTGCITTWRLTDEFCKQIPTYKSTKVVFTLTDYNRDYENDKLLVNILLDLYEEVYFWPQGHEDLQYLHSLKLDSIKVIAPNLKAYDDFLRNNECDFVGTRLHGGIRALQFKRRTLIIAIDNRAIEKSRDFNFNILPRCEIKDNLVTVLCNDLKTEIKINSAGIELWKKQFEDCHK